MIGFCLVFSESNPINWLEYSQENLRKADRERESSVRLRGGIAGVLSQVSQDMREQADRVEDAISRRVAETEEATRLLEIELKEVKL